MVIIRLRLRTGAKVGICILMALGSMYVPAAFPRLANALIRARADFSCDYRVAGCAIAKAVVLPSFWHADFTWQSIAPAQWAVAEQSLCIILASMPASKPLFDRALRAASSIRTRVEQTSKDPSSNTRARRKPMKHIRLTSIMITTDIRSSQRFEKDIVSVGSPKGASSFSSWVEPGQTGDHQRQLHTHPGIFHTLNTNKPLPCVPATEPHAGKVYGDKVKIAPGNRFEYVMMGKTAPWSGSRLHREDNVPES